MQRFMRKAGGILGGSSFLLLILAGSALADALVGKFKVFSEEAQMFSVVLEKTGVMFFKYDKKTVWTPGGKPTALQPEDVVQVTYKMKGDDNLATAVWRNEVQLPANVQAIPKAEIELLLRKRAAGVPVLLIDPRPLEQFNVAHLPGAVSIPLAQLDKRGGSQLPAKKDTILIFYGDGPTSDVASKAAILARDVGYLDVRLYLGGARGWVKEGGLLEAAVEYLRKGHPVLIDLRAPEVVNNGYIDGAASIPLATLAEAKGKFPEQRQIPVVFYGEQDEDLRKAATILQSWGYTAVSVFPGGVKAWQEAGEVLKTGAAPEIIVSAAMQHYGDLPPSQIGAVLGSPRSIVLVDVRSAAEYAVGHLDNAVNIPLPELAKRYTQLDKDKILVIYCSNGVRSGMAYEFLKKKDYKAMFINVKLKPTKDGNLELE